MKRESEKQRLVVAVAEREGRVLLFRRPDDSMLLAGTWELPWVREEGEGSPEAALAARYGGTWRLGPRLAEVRHGITWRDLKIGVHRAEVAEAGLAAGAGWFDAEARAGLAVSSLVGKVLGAVEEVSPAAASASAAGRPARRSRSRRRG